jgi:hypothetical protein
MIRPAYGSCETISPHGGIRLCYVDDTRDKFSAHGDRIFYAVFQVYKVVKSGSVVLELKLSTRQKVYTV